MSFCKTVCCTYLLTSYKCLKQFLNKHAANIYVNMVYSAFMTSDPLKVLHELKNQHIKAVPDFETQFVSDNVYVVVRYSS